MTTRRDFIKGVPTIGAAFSLTAYSTFEASPARAQTTAPHGEHFHPKGKGPSEHTLQVLAQSRNTLPPPDDLDFEENERGFIAPMPDKVLKREDGQVAWDMESFAFLDEDTDWPSIHPSLLRISRFNQNHGLYEVVPGIYQVRGNDISQISFVRGKTGWIIFDPLQGYENSSTALRVFQKHVGQDLPITAVVYSHNHGDHWAGIRGVVDEADVRAGKVEIIAPRGFLEAAIAENVYAGNAMGRRLAYQYGVQLPVGPFGFAGQGLGHRSSKGSPGLIPPTRTIEEDIEYIEVDGVRMVFQNTPDTEAPAEMNTYIPEMKALFMAENVSATLHNIYTLRGAPVRDALRWSKYLAESLYLFGTEAEVMFTPHHWPRWGNDRIQEIMRSQRDLYAHMNNQVLHLANQGVTINQIHNVYELPDTLQQKWYCRGYHGSPQHNSRAVVQRYLGYWDCNPATLIPPSPEASAPLYVEMMGGSDAILAKGQDLHNTGDYMMAVEILNKLFLAEADNQEARDLLADCYEQLGYQQENPGLRNCFLAGAYELRSGISDAPTIDTSTPDIVRAMPTDLFLNFLGIQMDARKAEGMNFVINFITPDNGEKFILELANSALTNIEGYLSDDPDLTLTVNRTDLERVMGGEATLADLIADGTVVLEGDAGVLVDLASTLVNFDPLFEILPGTKTAFSAGEAGNPFQADTGPVISE